MSNNEAREIVSDLLSEMPVISLPSFRSERAIGRMKQWKQTKFRTESGSIITGNELVSSAAKWISAVFEKAKEHDTSPLYWSLNDIILNNQCKGYGKPNDIDLRRLEWIKLWEKYPLLVVAVAKINDSLIHIPGESPTPKAGRTRISRSARHGGILADNDTLGALFNHARMFFTAKLEQNTVPFNLGGSKQDSFKIVQAENSEERTDFKVPCVRCESQNTSEQREPRTCIHHFC